MAENRVFILLGTYNGELYLREQIKSILDQTYQNWKLFIRDDGSDDDTIRILNAYQQQDKRIHLVVDNKGNLGALGSYNELCRIALKNNSDIVFFCDQDDVWLPDKIKTQIAAIKKIEDRHGRGCPILVYSDLEVVNEHLNRIHKSFLGFRGIKNPKKGSIRVLLTQNYITACSSAFNLALLKLATPIPDVALMHDWWPALCAAACGKISYIEKPTTLYRQHGSNTIGAKGLLNSINPFRNGIKARWQNVKSNFILSTSQAEQLKKRIQTQKLSIDPLVLKCIDTYANCLKKGRVERLKAVWENGIQRQGTLHRIFFYVLLLVSSTPHKPVNKIT